VELKTAVVLLTLSRASAFGVSEEWMNRGATSKLFSANVKYSCYVSWLVNFKKQEMCGYTPDMLGMGQHLAGLHKGVSKRSDWGCGGFPVNHYHPRNP
jgi:hypothetical protein